MQELSQATGERRRGTLARLVYRSGKIDFGDIEEASVCRTLSRAYKRHMDI
jgi:hypothetical protein